MHTIDLDFDIHLSEISKVEGSATLDIKVKNNRIQDLTFGISEWKRFYTQAIRGKPAVAAPSLLARICGTCSNAHLLASIKAVEKALSIVPSEQTMFLRKLLNYGLIIRDHALHLYIFSLPDVVGKASILDFDESDPEQHELMHDAFAVKEVGNKLSILTGGRSVHAPMPVVGGFLKVPGVENLKALVPELKAIRPKILKLIKVFAKYNGALSMSDAPEFSALCSSDFSFLEGLIHTTDGLTVHEEDLGTHLDGVILPYSHARGFTFDGKKFMVGALARVNLNDDGLHPLTRESAADELKLFPSSNIYHNNLAQAIEILHAIDTSIEMIEKRTTITPEPPIKSVGKGGVGIGVIEAPRGTLYYKLEVDDSGTVKFADIIVPTGQNLIIIERSLYELVERLLEEGVKREAIPDHCENLIRAYDPCMSCASHFLKVKWL